MRDLDVDKLNDHFGQYVIYLRCRCGHIRRCHPHTLAAFAGWEAHLQEVVRRLRCSKCNEKSCSVRTVAILAPRGYKSH